LVSQDVENCFSNSELCHIQITMTNFAHKILLKTKKLPPHGGSVIPLIGV
jgi:hypothetical protein